MEARNNGQTKIPVTIFPAKLSNKKHKDLIQNYKEKKEQIELWNDLKKGYDYFNATKQLPSIQFLNNGRHKVSSIH